MLIFIQIEVCIKALKYFYWDEFVVSCEENKILLVIIFHYEIYDIISCSSVTEKLRYFDALASWFTLGW
jgi:hypothetical protein